MNMVTVFFTFLAVLGLNSASGASVPHEMQHGFILAADDQFASHLVATGHHSRQTEIMGQLTIEDPEERQAYLERQSRGTGGIYFLFQAQQLDLPSLKEGQSLVGHIVESKIGAYDPKNVVVRKARYRVDRVLLNIENPFFGN